MTYPYGTPVTLVKRVKVVDANGKPVPDSFGNDQWTTTQTTVTAQAFVPGISTEQVQGQDMLTVQPTVYLPPGTDVSFLDAVIGPDGVQYEIDGSPNSPVSPFTAWQPGIIVKLRNVTG